MVHTQDESEDEAKQCLLKMKEIMFDYEIDEDEGDKKKRVEEEAKFGRSKAGEDEPDIIVSVMYKQTLLERNKDIKLPSNVHFCDDSNFDLDLDLNFVNSG
jgi:hypothetical protein